MPQARLGAGQLMGKMIDFSDIPRFDGLAQAFHNLAGLTEVKIHQIAQHTKGVAVTGG